jgi:predicted O-methyltransferase YrrM
MNSDKDLFNSSDVTLDWLKKQIPDLETNKFFTADWFTNGLVNFEYTKSQMETSPESILEIGCHEGRSTCWMLENLLAEDGSITCIDPFANDPLSAFRNEHPPENRIIEQIFCHNTDLAKLPGQTIRLMPTLSFYALAELITENAQFDFIYVDGSHSADEVLADAVMAFGLLKKNGYMIFDDYLWKAAPDSLDRPKMSIDAFVNMFQKHIEIKLINYQLVIQKV